MRLVRVTPPQPLPQTSKAGGLPREVLVEAAEGNPTVIFTEVTGMTDKQLDFCYERQRG